MTKVIIASTSCLCMAIASAYSQDRIYAGVSLGLNQPEDETILVDDNFLGTSFEADINYTDGASFGLFVGKELASFVSAEIELLGQSSDSDIFFGDDSFDVTALMVNAVISTPRSAPVSAWVGAGAGVAGTNIDNADGAFATQVKGGVDISLAGPHLLGMQVAYVETDGFDVRQGGTAFTVDYSSTAYSLVYKFRF